MDVPDDFFPFHSTQAANQIKTQIFRSRIGLGAVLLILTILLSNLIGSISSLILSGLLISPIVFFIESRWRSYTLLPLAVNLHHPFVDDQPLGTAAIQVRLLSGEWVVIGEHRVRTIPDELLGGSTLVYDIEEFPVIGHFATQAPRHPRLVRQLAIINQAVALRDLVNDVEDTIDEARAREGMETGLLERSWLEDEQGPEVSSPIVSFFRKDGEK